MRIYCKTNREQHEKMCVDFYDYDVIESIKGSVSEHGTDDEETERYQSVNRNNICEKS